VCIFQIMFFFWIFSAKICILTSSMRVRCFVTTQNFLFHNPNVICWLIKQETTYYTLPPALFIVPPVPCNAPFSPVHSVTLCPSMWGKQLNSYKSRYVLLLNTYFSFTVSLGKEWMLISLDEVLFGWEVHVARVLSSTDMR